MHLDRWIGSIGPGRRVPPIGVAPLKKIYSRIISSPREPSSMRRTLAVMIAGLVWALLFCTAAYAQGQDQTIAVRAITHGAVPDGEPIVAASNGGVWVAFKRWDGGRRRIWDLCRACSRVGGNARRVGARRGAGRDAFYVVCGRDSLDRLDSGDDSHAGCPRACLPGRRAPSCA